MPSQNRVPAISFAFDVHPHSHEYSEPPGDPPFAHGGAGRRAAPLGLERLLQLPRSNGTPHAFLHRGARRLVGQHPHHRREVGSQGEVGGSSTIRAGKCVLGVLLLVLVLLVVLHLSLNGIWWPKERKRSKSSSGSKKSGTESQSRAPVKVVILEFSVDPE